ncbi:D-glycero-beta-D-manno-heptose 1-phosphate adenylyltransferase [Pseudonocardia sp. S2-4]|uniref:D-glycero-beta-D-manno-heptose 1-phosphate adenylyltransferase n=1 Tax=Pseudonocardia humida TaxID=2800819 RepID=A0ABT0ZV06_9PSEU|nr:D-glycero-beta-D-manno-heptose 1-phosphate adenylyltransferase [Pseudonocardia humida]
MDPAEPRLARLIAERAPRVLVLGDALLDSWDSGQVHRTGRDGPVPVVEVGRRRTAPGGAANVAAALAALGARTELVTSVGDDRTGRTLRRALTEAGVRTDRWVIDPARPTAAKHRVLAGEPDEQLVARYDVLPPAPDKAVTRALADQASTALDEPWDAVLVADYGLGALDGPVRRRVRRARERIPLLVVDAHELGRWAELAPDAVTPSVEEAAGLLGEPVPDHDRASWGAARQHRLVSAAGGGHVLLTLDVDGVLWLPPEGPPRRAPAAAPAPAARACGAGDEFAAAWTAARACDVDPGPATALAQAAADVVVGRPATAVCGTGALVARLATVDRGRLLDHADLLAVLAERRAAGDRIVFTNGCFDVLHRGHVAYLQQARELGDLLVVALNSDASVSRLKGPTRPINPLADRAGVIGALAAVDLVTWFDTDSPVPLLEQARPDVYAKGGDYTAQMLPETPVIEAQGGEVRILDYLSDHSTTAIVDRVRHSPAEQA